MMDITVHRDKDASGKAQSQSSSTDLPMLCPFCSVRYKSYRSKPTRCQSCYIKFFAATTGGKATMDKTVSSQNHITRSNLTHTNQKIFNAVELERKLPSKNPGTNFSGKECSPALSCVGEKRKRNECGESYNIRGSNHNGDAERGQESESRKQVHEVDRSSNAKMDGNQVAQVGNSGDIKVHNSQDVIVSYSNRRGFNDIGRQEESGWGKQLPKLDRSEETLPNVINTNQNLNDNQDALGSSENLEVDKDSGLCDLDSGGAVQPNISECAGLKFDKMREEVNFAVGQAWALYDESDGMPRQYALIRKVSVPPFGIRITYLEPDPDGQKEIQWFEEDLPVSAGKFRLGNSHNTKDRSMFSHVIHCNKGSIMTGQFTVSPRKGETWALFKNWDINWYSKPDSHRKYEYEFVEILSDYTEGAGVSVAFLHKAKGFASVFFRMGTGGADTFQILPHSLYRFSHNIPSFKMKRLDKKSVPKDAYELDHAALPETIEEKSVPSHLLLAEPKPEALCLPSKGKVFQTGQIWSFYSGNDNLPRYYCRIQKITLTQVFEQEAVFKLHVHRLKAMPFPENVIQWEDKKMPVGCGTFFVTQVFSAFTPDHGSHQIVPQTSMDGNEYTILPKIGDVWAIYRFWTCHKEFKDVGCSEYDIVEILDDSLDYEVLALEPVDEDEEKKTVFRGAESRHPDCDGEDGSEVIFTIPKSKILRFAHQIPASRVKKEIQGELKEVFEVDYRAIPTNVRRNEHGESCNTIRGSNDIRDAERGEAKNSVCDGLIKFNDFDKPREEVNFAVGQTWALYDTADGMPRLYAHIRKVSVTSFGLRITYLEPDPDDEKEIQWFEQDLPVSAGKFRLGENENTKDRSKFSHVIHCNEGSNTGHLTISPRKGETWALFKNWDINWSSEPDSHRKYEYEFVEVLSDYSDEAGISVAFLHKAKGFASVFFRMGTGDADMYQILPHNLYNFSHRIPSFKMTGFEGKDLPKEAYELDQAALPETMEEIIVPFHLLAKPTAPKPKPEALCFPRDEEVFQTGQIWAYDGYYGHMPRYYCRIQKIALTQEFEQKAVMKLHVCRLKAMPFPEDVIKWKDKIMPVGCGTFFVGKGISSVLTPDHLSHQLVPQTSMDGNEYTILPKIGQVWVIYRSWNPHIGVYDLDGNYVDFDIVEVLDDAMDYKVLALEPANFPEEEENTFFRAAESKPSYRCDDEDGSEVIFTIPKSKMLRFSHQIPASRVTMEIEGELKEVFEVYIEPLPNSRDY